MNQHQVHKDQMTLTEFKLYMTGIINMIFLFLLSFLLKNFTTPIILLRLRLILVSVAFIFFLTVYIYYARFYRPLVTHHDIIIVINGKEFRL